MRHSYKQFVSFIFLGTLVGCSTPTIKESPPSTPQEWLAQTPEGRDKPPHQSLKLWWKNFKDPVLEGLIAGALNYNPDIRLAAAKIAEARGQESTAFAQLLPQISGVAAADRQRTAATNLSKLAPVAGQPVSGMNPITGKDYSAGFDASYEVDLFGKNRKAYKAAQLGAGADEKDYAWIKLSMIAEVARAYVSMRAQEKQIALAEKNLAIQQNTLELIRRLHKAGGASEFDVERTALQVSQTKANIKEYQRQRNVYFFSLVTLTGFNPQELQRRLSPGDSIPGMDLAVLIDTPANVLEKRPDIIAANLRFRQATSLKESQVAALFPTISLSGLFGLSKTLVTDKTTVWSYGGNMSVSLLDFGRIQGQINAASAREVQAFEMWRKAILQAIQDVETALTNVARLQDQRVALEDARDHAAKAWKLAEIRYREGDISLLDVLDAQYQLVEADSALVNAESNYVTAVMGLYKAIGQY